MQINHTSDMSALKDTGHEMGSNLSGGSEIFVVHGRYNSILQGHTMYVYIIRLFFSLYCKLTEDKQITDKSIKVSTLFSVTARQLYIFCIFDLYTGLSCF